PPHGGADGAADRGGGALDPLLRAPSRRRHRQPGALERRAAREHPPPAAGPPPPPPAPRPAPRRRPSHTSRSAPAPAFAGACSPHRRDLAPRLLHLGITDAAAVV